MTCFLDVQGFRMSWGYVIKEISIVCSQGKLYNVWMLRPPCRFEQLSIADRNEVRRVSNYQLALAWDDGCIPNKTLEDIFVQIGRRFTTWIVEDNRIKEIVFPFKPKVVEIQTLAEYCNELAGMFNVEEAVQETTYPEIGCMYDHPSCAVQNVTKLLNISNKARELQ